MDAIRYTHPKQGKLYTLRCILAIHNELKKYNYMDLFLEKTSDPEGWKEFSPANYREMHFRKDEEMILYAYGDIDENESRILQDIYDKISRFSPK